MHLLCSLIVTGAALAAPITAASPTPAAVLGVPPSVLNPSPAAPLTRELPAHLATCWEAPPDDLQGFHRHAATGRVYHVSPKRLEFGSVPGGDCAVALEANIEPPRGSSFVTVPSVSADGRTVVAGLAGGDVFIWRDGRSSVWSPGLWSARRTTVSSDGLYVFAEGARGTARHDVALGDTGVLPLVHFEPIDAFSAADDGFAAASSDRADKLIAWDLVTLRPRFARRGLRTLGFTHSGRWLVARTRDDRVVVLDALDGVDLAELMPCGAEPTQTLLHVAVAARAPAVWSVCDGPSGLRVRGFDLHNPAAPAASLTHQLAPGGWGLSALSVSPDGTDVALSEGGSHRLLVLDAETLQVTDTWRFGKRGVPTVKAWLAEGFVGQPAFDHAGVLATLGSPHPAAAWPSGGAYVTSATVLPDGHLLTGNESGTVTLRNADGRRTLSSWPAHDAAIRGLATTYDHQHLVTAAADGVHIWRL